MCSLLLCVVTSFSDTYSWYMTTEATDAYIRLLWNSETIKAVSCC